jgi:hypothetical protein
MGRVWVIKYFQLNLEIFRKFVKKFILW